MNLFKICAIVAVLASPLMADSISAFAVQQGHEVLLGNPDLVVRPTFYGSYLLLGSTMPSGFEGDIVFTLSVLGQDYVRTYDLTLMPSVSRSISTFLPDLQVRPRQI